MVVPRPTRGVGRRRAALDHDGGARPPADGGPNAEIALRLARRKWQSGARIDMQSLAAELGIDRTTLFRWVGNRDALLGEVLWSVGAPTWRNALASTTTPGACGVAEVMRWFVQTLIDSVPLRTFLRAEPERALRLLTTKASVVQREMVASVEQLLKQEQDRGTLTHPLPLHDLAYLITRIAESFIYNDVITGELPDASKAETAIGLLLGHRDPEGPAADGQRRTRNRQCSTIPATAT